MGFAKERQIQEWDQGWSFVETSCSYCGRSEDELIAAPMNDILRLIDDSLDYEYDDPNDAGVPVEGGEYVFDTMSTREVFAGLDTITENEDVMEEILNAFSDSAWVDKPFYSLAEDDELRYGWRDFVKAVKYERRPATPTSRSW